jgi:hypothetical protein
VSANVSKAVGRLISPVALAVGVMLAASAAAQLRLPLPHVPREVVAATAFLVLLTTIAACLGIRLLDLRCDWIHVTALATACAGLFVTSRAGLMGATATPFELLAVIAYAAWIEELVFRRLLPDAFMRATRSTPRRRPVYVVASQFLFAASHFVPGLQQQTGFGLLALMRLFVGGLLFAAVVSQCGLAVGALMHAELNLRAVLPQPPPHRASLLGVSLIALFALGVTLLNSSQLRFCQSLLRGPPHEK